METVRIITRGDLTGLIFQRDAPCAHTVVALAVTAAPDGAHSFDLSHWDVTHKGTGYRVTRESMPKAVAIALADRMAVDDRFPWESMKTDMTREQRTAFAAIRDEHLKAVTAARAH